MEQQLLLAVISVIEDSDSDDGFMVLEEESTSSSEDELEATVYIMKKSRSDLRKIPRIEGYIENTVSQYNRIEFKQHFRVFPETFDFILGLIGPKISFPEMAGGHQTIDAKKQLLMILWMMATPDSYRSVCEKFNVGRATLHRTMKRGTHALYSLAPQFILWPTGQRAIDVRRKFERFSAFPNTIGAIDGTHIQIYAPKNDGVSYINRKGTHSIQMQAVCTQDLIFTSVFAGYAGRVHDARVFRMSPVQNYIDNLDVYFEGGTHLIADAAYGIDPSLMVPFKDNGHLTRRQKNFNFCLSSARVSIERAFGQLKTHWRSIKDCLPMTSIVNVPEYLVALTVLHNICLIRRDLITEETNFRVRQRGILIENPIRRQMGQRKRLAIMNNLLIRNNQFKVKN